MPLSSTPIAPRLVHTVSGPLPYDQLGVTDAHNHVWITPVPGSAPGSPILDQFDQIRTELEEYRQKGGGTILDCQPGGCGRDARQLLLLSKASKANLIACTGFHRKKYYAPGYWLWQADAERLCDVFCAELEHGLVETIDTSSPVLAGFIKVALEASWAESPQAALEGAAETARRTHSLIEVHTEQGALAERASIYFVDRGVSPTQLVLCHMDKRPDLSLHQALAGFGVLLEYDTFFRPKYNPETNLWSLVEAMVSAGFSDRIAFATDMADAAFYHSIGGGPGLASLPGAIRAQLQQKRIPQPAQEQLLGANIARRLAGLH